MAALALFSGMDAHPSVGEQLRGWRLRRRMSQLDLALDAEISSRHLSFLETGRARPSREMLLRLAERLDVPLRERNVLLTAAGFAASFPERTLDHPALSAARSAVDLVLKGHEPFPALAVDRHWTIVSMNQAVTPLLADVESALLQPPVNALRISLHPDGLAPRIANFFEWRGHLLDRLRRQVELSGDATLAALRAELAAYPVPCPERSPPRDDYSGVFVPLRLRMGESVLNVFSTTTMFGTPTDVTLSELAIEAFFPADPQTAAALQSLAP